MENTKILHSRRLLLKKFTKEDLDKDLQVFNHKNFKNFEEEKIEDTKKYLEEIIENYQNKKDFHFWHIVKLGENQSLGLLKLIKDDKDFSVKIIISEKYQNRGYATEALNLILSEFLTDREFEQIKLKIEKENQTIKEVLKKCHIKSYKEDDKFIYYKMTNIDYMKYFAIYGDIDI